MISPLPSIVTLADAKAAAKITTAEDDQILYAYLETAHELVLDYLDNQIDDSSDAWVDEILTWEIDPNTNMTSAPKRVIAAIIICFQYMSRFRGDDDAKVVPPQTQSGLPQLAEALLGRLRDPTIA